MKIASRYLLPLELFLSILMISWGLSGWFGGGLLWKTLHLHGLNDEFGLALCGTGFAQLAVCSLEWLHGRRWPWSKVLAAVRARYWLAFVSIVLWIWVAYALGTRPGSGASFALFIQVPAAIGFLFWVYAVNRMTAHVLDPQVSTKRLQAELLAERDESLRAH